MGLPLALSSGPWTNATEAKSVRLLVQSSTLSGGAGGMTATRRLRSAGPAKPQPHQGHTASAPGLLTAGGGPPAARGRGPVGRQPESRNVAEDLWEDLCITVLSDATFALPRSTSGGRNTTL